MSIITVSSTNPNLSHILAKNPATILEQKKPFEREVRKGSVYGWYTNPNSTQFRLMFIDSPVDNSFGDSDFEYLDTARYASPYAPIAMMTAALASATNVTSEYDKGEFVSGIESNIKIPARILERFAKVDGFVVSYKEITKGYYKLAVVGTSVSGVLNLFQVICFIACLADRDTYLPLGEVALEKYIRSLNFIKAPYFLRYLVSSRALNNRTSFDRLEPRLSTDTIKLKFGDTQMQRHDAIRRHLGGGESLIDVGCGEMFHALRLSANYTEVVVIDADEEIHNTNVRKIQSRRLDEKFTSMNEMVDQHWVLNNDVLLAGADVLISECLEHIEQPNAEDLLHALLKSSVRKIVLTVPNQDFNVHYGFEEGDIRHEDHKWEPTGTQWDAFVSQAMVDTAGWKAVTSGIGDSVDGVHISLMTVFERT